MERDLHPLVPKDIRVYAQRMRSLRSQLIQRFRNTEQEIPSPRLFSTLLQQSLLLLQQPQHVALNHRQLSLHQFHRHVVVLRCPDQAFYLDAIRRYFSCHNIQPLALHTIVMSMTCNEEHCSLSIQPPTYMGEDNFMLIAVHLSAAVIDDIQPYIDDFQAILNAVHVSVQAFSPMKKQLIQLTQRLLPTNPSDAALLQWMSREKYVLIGVKTNSLQLGIFEQPTVLEHIAPHLQDELRSIPNAQTTGIEWLQLPSSQTHLYSKWGYEVVRITWLEQNELRQLTLLGHFSRTARQMNAHHIPHIDTVWQHIYTHPTLRLSAFYLREVRMLFDRFPKHLLLSIEPQSLLKSLDTTVRMTDTSKVHLCYFNVSYQRVWFIFLAFETTRYTPHVLNKILTCIKTHDIQIYAHHDYEIESRRIILISCSGKQPKETQLHSAIQACIYLWRDRVRDLIMQQSRHIDVPQSLKQLSHMPLLYQQFFEPKQFLTDMNHCAHLLQQQRVQVNLIHTPQLECHFFSTQPLPLGKLVMYVQNIGLQAQQEIVVQFEYQNTPVYLSSLRATTSDTTLKKTDYPRLAHALQKVINQEEDNDALNALVLTAALHIEHVSVLICIRNHLIQLIDRAAPMALNHVMLNHPHVSAALYHLFEAQHQADTRLLDESQQKFQQQLLHITQLDEDRWFRALAELVESGVRTNAFIRQAHEPIAIKIDPQRLSFAPQPRPYREIFVHGVHLEAIHLRGGKVARGGIRHSDRPNDFRTEVLELMATQVLKNGVIVPTGAKGGFVVRDRSSPEDIRKQYCVFMNALLTLTDHSTIQKNQQERLIYIPEKDQNDPYLVVAADKGTARFSDFANQAALDHGFWLGDAFASGGSHGYDHKAYGITARGAWVCALHLCHRLNIDPNQPLSVVAIGDMSGDVFGNGMLRQSPLHLVAAFNHQHIFLDPNPDTTLAQQERQRLFEQRAGWEHYQSSTISEGGGVFLRSSKSIKISKQVQQVLDIEQRRLSGEALIQAILSASVDILFNGGIGTYVKASQQSHLSVHDPVNDSVRVNASHLRCRIVCEGGNLGFSQQARLEYSQKGGLISSDAIDNSAGVDMSDHEVNIKILIQQTDINDKQRDQLLNQIGEDVVQLCLNDNQAQAQLLSVAERDIQDNPLSFYQLRHTLLQEKRLDMRIDACIAQDDALTLRPQLAVLMGHEKNRIYQALSTECFDPQQCFSHQLLHQYFPHDLQQHYATNINQHPLAKEIIATQAVNHVLNHCGLCAVHELQYLTHCTTSEAVWALLLAHQWLGMTSLQQQIWQQCKTLDTAIPLQQQCQQWLRTFARQLLFTSLKHTLTQQTMQHIQRALQNTSLFSETQKNGETYKDIWQKAELNQENIQCVMRLPQLIQSAAAIEISVQQDVSLQSCLKTLQECFNTLPFIELEAALFSNEWSEPDAHTLRCEWLQRLNILRIKYIKSRQNISNISLPDSTKNTWINDEIWQPLTLLQNQKPHPMKLLLLLGYLDKKVQE